MLNGLDLFSGVGGNSLGLRNYVKTIAYCERDRHAQAVLLSRMADGSLSPAPIWDDITTLNAGHINAPVDIIIGGFPCQDISVAGKGEGLEGKRSGLFFEIVRLAKEIKPTFLFLENVPAIRTRRLDIVIQELAEAGYDCRWTMLSAEAIGAPHKRERWFCLAHSNRKRLEVSGSQRSITTNQEPSVEPHLLSSHWGTAFTELLRVAHGIPHRVDRIKRLGNAVVPQQAKEAFEKLLGIMV